jgi:hypothetical protein
MWLKNIVLLVDLLDELGYLSSIDIEDALESVSNGLEYLWSKNTEDVLLKLSEELGYLSLRYWRCSAHAVCQTS